MAFGDAVQVAVGARGDGAAPVEATLDEVALWKRALSEAEIAALYGRGAGRVALQVRVCPTATCDGVPFVGPGGDADAWFLDPTGALAPNDVALTLPPGRYFQYRVALTALGPAAGPALSRGEVQADPGD